MENINLIDTFSEFKELKNIDRVTMMSVLEDVFRGMLQKKYGSDENFDIIINIDKGDFEIWRNREVVEDDELEDSALQIRLSEAKKIDENTLVIFTSDNGCSPEANFELLKERDHDQEDPLDPEIQSDAVERFRQVLLAPGVLRGLRAGGSLEQQHPQPEP